MNPVQQETIRVMIADDHALIRQGLMKVLSLDPGIQVIAEARDGQEAIDKARSVPVDVILMDINMPQVNGITAVREIRTTNPRVSIIALTIHDQEEYLVELIKCGVSGYVLKDVHPDELVQAIQKVYRGKHTSHRCSWGKS